MNSKLILLSISLLYFAFSTQPMSAGNGITYSYLEAKRMSVELQKPIFAYFTSDQEFPALYERENLVAIKEKYIPLFIDASTFEGSTLIQYYNVANIPSLLILDSDGKVLKRTNQELSGEELSYFIKDPSGGTSDILPKKSKPLQDEIITSHKYNHTESTTPAQNKSIKKEHHPATTLNTITSHDNNDAQSKYGIQTGVFSSMDNAESSTIQLKRLFNEPISIKEDIVNNKKLFRVIIGQFPQKSDAEQFLQLLLDYNIKGLIKSVSLASKL